MLTCYSDNDVLQERVSSFEQYYEQKRQRLLAPRQRTRDFDFDSDPPSPSESSSDAVRQDTLLATCTTDVFQILIKTLTPSPERVSSIQSAHSLDRPLIPLFPLPDRYYYIDRDGDPCVTPDLLSLLPSPDEQPDLLNIVKDVFILQPLGSHSELVRRADLLRDPASAVRQTNIPSRLNRLGLYAIVAGAFALASIGSPVSPPPEQSSTRATTLYVAGRRALQLVIDHPQSPPNPVDRLWAAMLLLQFLLFSHKLPGGEQPHSGAWHREWVPTEISLVLRIIVHVCGEQQENQSLQQPDSQEVSSRDLQERAKLASAAYYYEM